MSRLLYHGMRKAAGFTAGIVRRDQPAVEHGSIYDRIRGMLGEDEYDELCQDSALVLEAISYCQTELSWVESALLASRRVLVSNFDENQQKKRLLNHDSLMLKLRPGIPNRPAIYILAEKVGSGDDDGSKAGILISVIPEGAEDLERRCCLRRIECSSQIGLLELTATLKKKSPHYDIQHDNCWHYAEKTTEFVLQACIQRKSNGSEDQKRLQKELKDLKANIFNQHAVNTVERVVKYAKSHVFGETEA